MLLTAAPANASKAEVTSKTEVIPCTGKCPGYEPTPVTTHALTYAAAAGEQNTLTVTPSSDAWTLSDPGATIEAGTGCTSVDAHTVRCTPSSFSSVRFELGDGNDSLDARAAKQSVAVVGGPGDDKLRAGAGPDSIDAGTGADDVDGGAGYDSATYADRTTAVSIDLAKTTATQGEPGEGDRLADVESVVGGSGNDVMSGSAAGDSLDGAKGNDRLIGRAGNDGLFGGEGNDVLIGGAGSDSLDGDMGNDTLTAGTGNDELDGGPGQDSFTAGAGNDTLDIADGRADSVACGAGNDLVESEEPPPDETDFDAHGESVPPDPQDVIARDCERVDLGGEVVRAAPLAATRREVVFRSPCLSPGDRIGIRVSIGRRLVGSAPFKKCIGRQRVVRVPLRGLGSRTIVSVRWHFYDGFDTWTGSYRTILF